MAQSLNSSSTTNKITRTQLHAPCRLPPKIGLASGPILPTVRQFRNSASGYHFHVPRAAASTSSSRPRKFRPVTSPIVFGFHSACSEVIPMHTARPPCRAHGLLLACCRFPFLTSPLSFFPRAWQRSTFLPKLNFGGFLCCHFGCVHFQATKELAVLQGRVSAQFPTASH
jgi:hypothetical protein